MRLMPVNKKFWLLFERSLIDEKKSQEVIQNENNFSK